MDKTLENSKIIQKFAPHVQVVETSSGSKRILKFTHENFNSDAKTRELINELVVLEFSAYAKICNSPTLRFHDLELLIEKDDYPFSWSIFDSNPNIKVVNAEQFPLAFGIDWVTGQQDRWHESKENARLQKLEDGSYLFGLTDNGQSLLGPNGDFRPDATIDSQQYTSRLLFSIRVNSREELEKAIGEIEFWPISTIVLGVAEKLLNCGCTFSIEKREFILNYCVEVINFINFRKRIIREKLLSWWDETHKPIDSLPQEEQVSAQ